MNKQPTKESEELRADLYFKFASILQNWGYDPGEHNKFEINEMIEVVLSERTKALEEGRRLERERITSVLELHLSSWKDPEWEFQLYETLVNYTKDLIFKINEALFPESERNETK